MATNLETVRDAPQGNTDTSGASTSKKKQPLQLINWFFTFNNYDNQDIDMLETTFRQLCKSFCFQEEIGAITGTKHLQGVITLKEKMRHTELGLSKKIHWEKVASIKDAYLYCCKTESRNGRLIYMNYTPPREIKCIKESDLRPFQSEILRLSKLEPDGRTIYWIIDEIGNTGKSQFCRFMALRYNAFVIQGGKLGDIMNMVFNEDMNSVYTCIIDIPRCNKNNVSYASIECILNGMITNTKFETGRKIFNPPHIFVFSNFYPDTEKLSNDRWKLFEINNNFELKKLEC